MSRLASIWCKGWTWAGMQDIQLPKRCNMDWNKEHGFPQAQSGGSCWNSVRPDCKEMPCTRKHCTNHRLCTMFRLPGLVQHWCKGRTWAGSHRFDAKDDHEQACRIYNWQKDVIWTEIRNMGSPQAQSGGSCWNSVRPDCKEMPCTRKHCTNHRLCTMFRLPGLVQHWCKGRTWAGSHRFDAKDDHEQACRIYNCQKDVIWTEIRNMGSPQAQSGGSCWNSVRPDCKEMPCTRKHCTNHRLCTMFRLLGLVQHWCKGRTWAGSHRFDAKDEHEQACRIYNCQKDVIWTEIRNMGSSQAQSGGSCWNSVRPDCKEMPCTRKHCTNHRLCTMFRLLGLVQHWCKGRTWAGSHRFDAKDEHEQACMIYNCQKDVIWTEIRNMGSPQAQSGGSCWNSVRPDCKEMPCTRKHCTNHRLCTMFRLLGLVQHWCKGRTWAGSHRFDAKDEHEQACRIYNCQKDVIWTEIRNMGSPQAQSGGSCWNSVRPDCKEMPCTRKHCTNHRLCTMFRLPGLVQHWCKGRTWAGSHRFDAKDDHEQACRIYNCQKDVIWTEIRNMVPHKHNLEVHAGTQSDLIVKKCPVQGSTAQITDYVPCSDCLAYFNIDAKDEHEQGSHRFDAKDEHEQACRIYNCQKDVIWTEIRNMGSPQAQSGGSCWNSVRPDCKEMPCTRKHCTNHRLCTMFRLPGLVQHWCKGRTWAGSHRFDAKDEHEQACRIYNCQKDVIWTEIRNMGSPQAQSGGSCWNSVRPPCKKMPCTRNHCSIYRLRPNLRLPSLLQQQILMETYEERCNTRIDLMQRRTNTNITQLLCLIQIYYEERLYFSPQWRWKLW